MAVTIENPAPYAPASAVLEVINRYRNRGLASPVIGEVLGRAGVSDSLIPRTLQALETLDLIDEKGVPTSTLDGLRLAPEAEFKRRLGEWLNAAYADVLKYVDPATADEVKVRDAFRTYTPIGQQPRMVTLFTGLYTAAGVITDKKQPASRPGGRTNTTRAATSNPRGAPANTYARKPVVTTGNGDMPPALAGLLAELPPLLGTGWTKEKRDSFLATFSSVLNYCIPIVEPGKVSAEETPDE